MDNPGTETLHYSLALALSDYIPVLLSTTALALLARHYEGGRRGLTLSIATALVFVGGAAKASWKLSIALGWGDIPLLNALLFVGLASGFSLFLLRYVQLQFISHEQPLPAAAWIGWLVIVAVAIFSLIDAHRGLRLTLIAITALSAVGLGGYLCWQAIKLRSHAAWSLGLHSLLMLSMNAIARQLSSEESAQWQAQGLNTIAQGLLLLGVWQYLYKHKELTRTQARTPSKPQTKP